MTPEFSRSVRAHEVGSIGWSQRLEANPTERAALAARFNLLALDALTADLVVVRDAAGIRVTGRIAAAGSQACVVSAEPVVFALDEPVDLGFSDAAFPVDDEIELAVSNLDTLPLEGDDLDLGEAVAQSLGLALDPYPRASPEARAAAAKFVLSPDEAEALTAADKARASPFAMLRRAE